MSPPARRLLAATDECVAALRRAEQWGNQTARREIEEALIEAVIRMWEGAEDFPDFKEQLEEVCNTMPAEELWAPVEAAATSEAAP